MMWSFQPLNLQFPFFVQYIALFVVGLVAYRRNWFLTLPAATGRLWLAIAVVVILLFWPSDRAAARSPTAPRSSWAAGTGRRWHTPSGSPSSVCPCASAWFTSSASAPTSRVAWQRFLSRNAYTAYLIHGPVIVIIAYVARDAAIYPLLKWLLVALVAVPVCFLLSSLIRKLPGTERVL